MAGLPLLGWQVTWDFGGEKLTLVVILVLEHCKPTTNNNFEIHGALIKIK